MVIKYTIGNKAKRDGLHQISCVLLITTITTKTKGTVPTVSVVLLSILKISTKKIS
jgi:hypothetical protein